MTAPHKFAIGVDIGGTRVRVGLVAGDGRLLARAESLLPPLGEPEPLVAAVREQLRTVLADWPPFPAHEPPREALPSADALPVVVALPGVWNSRGVMQRAVNLPRLEGVDLHDLFAAGAGRPVRLEADASAALWGQYSRLSPQPPRVLYLSLGTGVGGGAIVDGRLVRCTRGGAGHFGFLIVDTRPGAPAGKNNVPGCLSAFASGPALHLAATGLHDQHAIGDEPLPDAVLETAAEALAVAFMNLGHVYAPELILLGGGVIDNHPRLVDLAASAFARRAGGLLSADLRVHRAPLTTHEAGVIGAAMMALEAEPS